MSDDLRRIFEDDQFEEERRQGRRLTLAIANDIIAYHGALKGAGIDGDLLATLTTQFSAHWLGPVTSDAQIVFSMEGMDE